MELKETRIRAITNLYYSNTKIQELLVNFSKNREVVPRYFEGFGKRPDTIQYNSDVINLVKKGATSFHASEELWEDPLKINSDLSQGEINKLRKGWDLLIDIDSPFLDCSKIAAKLIIEFLEQRKIKSYGIKFSGSKGFHIIISNKSFPKEFGEFKTKDMFPEWPRAICQYILNRIRHDYNKRVSEMNIDLESFGKRTNSKIEDLTESLCPECGRPAKRGKITILKCNSCHMQIERKDYKLTKRRLKCLSNDCAGILEAKESKDYSYCEYCSMSNWDKSGKRETEKFQEEVSANKFGSLDLVLVAPRHLFRMPYSLHEKTALASIVLSKEELEDFDPKFADPMKLKIKDFVLDCEEGEARNLLFEALEWKKGQEYSEKKYENKLYENREYSEINPANITEEMFPASIKKLLKGLEEGKKRGLFVLITFLRSLNFSIDYVYLKVREWNEKNKPPLREGYLKGQIEWHFKQKRKILPPNYDNESFYKDLGLIEGKQKVKNPLVEVLRNIRN